MLDEFGVVAIVRFALDLDDALLGIKRCDEALLLVIFNGGDLCLIARGRQVEHQPAVFIIGDALPLLYL